MKKIRFYITEYDFGDDILLETIWNSKFRYDGEAKKTFFKSNYSDHEEEIYFNYSLVKFDETLFNELCKIIQGSYKRANEIVLNGKIGGLKQGECLSTPIFSAISKFSDKHQKLSFFEFIADIFISYLNGHKLYDGNKRLSLMILIDLLRYFGYHMFWTKGDQVYYEYYEKDLECFVVRLEDKNDKNCKNDIIKWIKTKIVIAIEFRS